MLVGMIAAGAFFRRRLALMDVSAYEAKPFDRLLTLPHGAIVDQLQTVLETVVV